ncbi:MAG: ferrous iron transporter B [Clostridiales bacterium]|nr:ferrous iron transporter B [Clostridiales bacterium]
MKRFALLGNPNSGKTTLFNSLTGSAEYVGNWPGVTAERKEGSYKKCGEPITIVDLPGIYSLSPYTPEEVVSRNFILDEKPDLVINIVDATNLERNLYLTTQIMEIDVPMVIALNMMDALTKAGDKIDIKKLEEKIGVPVVEISALREDGLDELMRVAYEESKKERKGVSVIEHPELCHLIGDVKIALEAQKVDNPLFHAVKFVELDELEMEMHQNLVKMVDDFKKTFSDDTFGTDFDAIIADSRYKYITKNYSSTLKRKHVGVSDTKSDKIDKVLTHKWFGIPIFLVILLTMFHLTFSENFLFLGGILGEDFVSLPGTAFEGVFGEGAIYSPGVILLNLMGVFTDWLFGLIGGLFSNSAPWVQGLFNDGIFAGLGSVLSFIPQILLLLLLFSILEDSGYMARVAFMLDRMFRRFGLSGRAVLPMIMGFGCSVPAIINTRTLADEKEKVATIRVIPFFSCGAKLPILTAVSAAIISYFNFTSSPDLIVYSMYVVGVVVAIIAIIIMRGTTMKGETPPFIMELPSYHMPQFKNLMIHLWDKAKHFIKKAFTIIVASSIVVWVLTNFTFGWAFIEDGNVDNSILGGIGKLVQPIFTPLGFGSQLNANGWVFIVAAIIGLIAKENVIAAFGILSACIAGGAVSSEEGVKEVVTIIGATGISWQGAIAFIIFNMTTIPCFAAVATAKAEIRDKKTFSGTMLFWLVASYIASTVCYLALSYWWTAIIFVAILVITLFVIRKINLRSKKV